MNIIKKRTKTMNIKKKPRKISYSHVFILPYGILVIIIGVMHGIEDDCHWQQYPPIKTIQTLDPSKQHLVLYSTQGELYRFDFMFGNTHTHTHLTTRTVLIQWFAFFVW